MHTYTLTCRLGALVVLAALSILPARAQSYTSAPITNAFFNIASIGTPVPGAEGDDVISVSYYFADVAPGFSFPYYGQNRDGFRVSSNGFITFRHQETSSSAGNPSTVPSSSTPNDYIAPFWDDLDNDGGLMPLEQVDYYHDTANSRFIVQWTNARLFAAGDEDLTFQLHLYATGAVEYHYATMTLPGTSHTVALENGTGTAGTSVIINAAGIASNAAYRFTYAVPSAAPACLGGVNTPSTTPGAMQFTWTASTAVGSVASGYRVDIGTTAGNPTDIVSGAVVVQGVFPFAMFPSTTYHWRVTPFNAAGAASGCTVNAITSSAGSGVVSTFPHTQTFGSSTSIPTGWTQDPADANESWLFATTATAQGGPASDHTTGTGSFAYVSDASTDNDPVNMAAIPFNLASLTAPRVRFWHQNSSATSNTADVPVLHLDVSTNGHTWTSVASNAAVLRSWTEFTADLTPYAGQKIFLRFRARERGAGIDNSPSIDDVTVDEVPTAPIFSMSPSGTVSFGTAGACTSPATASQTFTISNSGAGNLLVNGATLGGATSAAYAITAAPSYPVTLAPGQNTTITVTFTPSVGMTGTQTGTLDVNYNNGSAQTATANLTGTASATNFAVSSATTNTAGYAFRNSSGVSACTAGSPVAAPGTALIPFADHTRITFTPHSPSFSALDDGFFQLMLNPATTGIGSFRFFGRDYASFWVNTNGNITFGAAAGNFYGALPSTTGGGSIQAAAMDVNMDHTLYATDDDGVGGLPGVFYGAEDVDGDNDDELVVTWYHAYDFNSASYPNAAASFFTVQLILFDASDPNREDRVEVRFLDGLDANGIPFRQNTAGAPVENDVTVGLTNPTTGTVSSEYRDNSTGGPLYGSNLGVRFEAEVQALADAPVRGWRMMGAPVSSYTVSRLAELNLVQSVVGQYPDHTDDNVYIDYDGTGFVPATNVTDALTPGQGFIWYLFNQSYTPGPTTSGGGTSRSYALPMELEGTGAEVSGTTFPITLHTAGDKWNLIANPFRQSLNVTNLATWVNSGGALVSGVGEIWKPTSASPPYGTYVLTTDEEVSNIVTAWQGLFVQNNTATTLNVPTAARTTGGSFVGRTGDPLADEVRRVGFELASGGAGGPLLDRAAILYFHPGASAGWDLWDASKLAPLSPSYATIAFGGGPSRLTAKAQESRPFDGGVFDVPMQFDAVGMSGQFTLSWPRITNVPDTWTLSLSDRVTGEVVDLRQATSYTFEASGTSAREAGGDAEARAAQARPEVEEIVNARRFRFVLHVEGGEAAAGAALQSAANAEVPAAFALQGAFPNPFAEATTIRYDVPEASRVTLEVYDLLGRRVATLVDEVAEPGYQAVPLPAHALASGVYVVRMQADTGFSQTHRVTVLK